MQRLSESFHRSGPMKRVEPNRKNDDGPYDDLLDECRYRQKIETIDHERDNEHAQRRAKHPSATAEYAGAADNDGPDRLKQKISGPQDRLTRDYASAEKEASNGREGAAHQIDKYLRPSDVDAGHQSDLLISADRVDRSPDRNPGQQQMADRDEDRGDDEGDGYRPYKAAAEPKEGIDVRLWQAEQRGAAGVDHGGACII